MTGSIVRRSKKSWALVIDRGRDANGKRRQQWIKFKPDPTKKIGENQTAAEAKLRQILGELDKGNYVEPSKLTLIDVMRAWYDERIAPTARPATRLSYRNIIEKHVAPSILGAMPIQKVKAGHIESHYLKLPLSPVSIGVHHAVLSSVFEMASKNDLIATNPMRQHRIKRPVADTVADGENGGSGDVLEHCWNADEARRFLAAANAEGPMVAAFFALALDCGARKSELFGTVWDRLDLDARTLRIDRQLTWAYGTVGHAPLKTSKKSKNKGVRIITLSPGTVALLRTHRAAQAALKMKNRTTYQDRGFVFAVEPEHCIRDLVLGDPHTSLDRTIFERVIKRANVKRIKFHGLRHSCASLLLAAGEPLLDVSKRLGHADPSMTLRVYGHVLDGAQESTASRIGSLLYGR